MRDADFEDYARAIRSLGEHFRLRKQLERQWITRARALFDPSRRESCAVCGKYRSLSHAHHIVPLSIQVRQREPMPLNTHAWLCPTHHAATHMLIAQQDRANEVGDDFKTTSTMTLVTIDLWSEREYSAVFEIAGACWLALHDYVDAPFGDYSLALLRDRLADVDQKERTLSLAIAERWPTNQWQGELDALLERCRESA